ncbi:hypothetical protein AMTR_s00080p00137790 [Amborella trichopoda]|uniref:Uncharacterized protein n=1 Tax=Amborella trichopoda TaxID=13333 RepID=W1PB65_AMBTC|nr:hypothetical protein AMTR_s00080p00137790 [Amborella trichopoda]
MASSSNPQVNILEVNNVPCLGELGTDAYTGVDLPPRLKKRAKTKASPNPTLPSEVTVHVQETVPEVVVAQPSSSGQTTFNLSRRSESAPPPIVEIEAPLAEKPTEPIVVQCPTLSSLSQENFLCTITEEGHILEKHSEANGIALNVEVTTSKVLALTTLESEPQPDVPSSATLEFMVVPTSEVPISTIPEYQHEGFVGGKLAMVKSPGNKERLSLFELTAEIDAVRDYTNALRVISYDKETFDRFEGLVNDFERWVIEALQCESEVRALYGTHLASLEVTLTQHQSLLRGYDAKKTHLLSYQAGFKKEDLAYYAEIKAAEEERARLNIYIHQLKTKQDQKRENARRVSRIGDIEF